MEGCDRAQGGKIKEKNPIIERDLIIEKRKNIIALRTVIVTKSKRNIYIYIYPRITLLGHGRRRISLYKLVFSLFFLLSHYLWSIVSIVQFFEA